jgi:hypothetical protein
VCSPYLALPQRKTSYIVGIRVDEPQTIYAKVHAVISPAPDMSSIAGEPPQTAVAVAYERGDHSRVKPKIEANLLVVKIVRGLSPARGIDDKVNAFCGFIAPNSLTAIRRLYPFAPP